MNSRRLVKAILAVFLGICIGISLGSFVVSTDTPWIVAVLVLIAQDRTPWAASLSLEDSFALGGSLFIGWIVFRFNHPMDCFSKGQSSHNYGYW
jgi:hypothetical protein